MKLPQGPSQRWSLDFVSDMLADRRWFRVLVVVDDFTRECLALVVDTSLSGMRVARELDTIAQARGRPLMVVSDYGTELTSRAILQWQEDIGRCMSVFLDALTGMVVLGGYPDAPYDDRLGHWRRVSIRALADGAREREEVLWLNPACAAVLDARHGGHGTPLFSVPA